MKKQFLADKSGKIKASWVWANDDIPCPHPHPSIVASGDVVLDSIEEDYQTFHSEFLTRISERMVTRDELSVVSVNSGRLVLDNLVKQT